MTKLKAAMVALALLAPTAAQAASPPTVAYPGFYEFHWRMQQCNGKKYFNCDYTSKTCLYGYSLFPGSFAGVVLAEDRKTVLAHIVQITQDQLFNVDTGERNEGGRMVRGSFYYDSALLASMRRGNISNAGLPCSNPYEPVPE